MVLRWARSVLPHEIVRWMGKDHSCKGVPPEMQSSALQSAYCDLTVAFGRLGYRLFSGGLGSRLAAEHDPAANIASVAVRVTASSCGSSSV